MGVSSNHICSLFLGAMLNPGKDSKSSFEKFPFLVVVLKQPNFGP